MFNSKWINFVTIFFSKRMKRRKWKIKVDFWNSVNATWEGNWREERYSNTFVAYEFTDRNLSPDSHFSPCSFQRCSKKFKRHIKNPILVMFVEGSDIYSISNAKFNRPALLHYVSPTWEPSQSVMRSESSYQVLNREISQMCNSEKQRSLEI